jgi:hypothetical protein
MNKLAIFAICVLCLSDKILGNYTLYTCHSMCVEGFCNGPGEANCLRCKGNRMNDFGKCVCKPSFFGPDCEDFLDVCDESSIVNGVRVCTKCMSDYL